jgi:RNase P subunit RPR2
MQALLNFLFGCSHQRVTWPQGRAGQTYVACLDCGREFRYDWLAMRIGEPRPWTPARAQAAEGERG